MLNIDDDGKIWLQGSSKPEYGVRVGDLCFVIGQVDTEISSCFVYGENLIVDLDNPDKKYRILRKFPFNLKPQTAGTLFNGFKKTKHADIKAITYKDAGVEECAINEEEYTLKDSKSIETIKLMKLVGWVKP